MNTSNGTKNGAIQLNKLFIWGLIYGAFWSIVPGVLSELLWSPWQAKTVIASGMVTGTIVTFALAPLLRRTSTVKGALLGVLSLPLGAWLFGLAISCLHWIVLKTTGTHFRFVMQIDEYPGYIWAPLDVAWQYAVFSMFTIFAVVLLPLAILTTLHLQRVVQRTRTDQNAVV